MIFDFANLIATFIFWLCMSVLAVWVLGLFCTFAIIAWRHFFG